jgi:hypothetical protein
MRQAAISKKRDEETMREVTGKVMWDQRTKGVDVAAT